MKVGTRLSYRRELSESSASSTHSDTSDHNSDSSKTSVTNSTPSSRTNSPYVTNPQQSKVDEMCLLLLQTREIKQAVRSLGWRLSSTPSTSPDELNFPYPRLFTSLCICDPNITGYPIQLHTPAFALGPRGMQLGACKFLNLPFGDHDTCDLFPEPADARNTTGLRFTLEYAGNLVSRKAGPVMWVLAAKMDVTDAMRTLARRVLAAAAVAPASANIHDATSTVSVDYWLAAAAATTTCTTGGVSVAAPAIPPALLHEFSELLADLRFFHRDVFTLHADPLTGFWRIPWLSPSLAAREADRDVALGRTPQAVLDVLGGKLSGDEPCSLMVLWGVEGVHRRVYAVPMKRHEWGYWVCFLLPAGIPNLWSL